MPVTQLLSAQYRPHFTGHETFPLRYGWLKKAYDAVVTNENESEKKSVFNEAGAVANFGVGKNMVASMRHWAVATKIIEENDGELSPGDVGKKLFGNTLGDPLDPYLENPSSLWLLHWQLCRHSSKTTWHFLFNYFHAEEFERSVLVDALLKLTQEKGWGRVSAATVKRDVECLLRCYVPKPETAKTTPEDTLECPLAELGLIKMTGKRDGFRLVRGSKPTLGDGVFLYALVDFWAESRYADLNQLPFEAIAYEPGSPGRIFLLDENDLADRLTKIEIYSNGVLSWSETSGIRAIIKNPGRGLRGESTRLGYIHDDYQR